MNISSRRLYSKALAQIYRIQEKEKKNDKDKKFKIKVQ